MEQMELESQAKAGKRERAEAAMARARRLEMFRRHGLNDEDITRTNTMSAGDPVSSYIGYPEIQAQMIADEKDAMGGIRGKIGRVAQGIADYLGIGTEGAA